MIEVFPHQRVPLLDRKLAEERMFLFRDALRTHTLKFLEYCDQLLFLLRKISILSNDKVRIGWEILIEWSWTTGKFFLRDLTKQESDDALFELEITQTCFEGPL